MAVCENHASEEPVFDTAPPDDEPLLKKYKRRASERLSAAILPLVKRAAGAYVGGESVGEALAVANRLAVEGHAATLGYWDVGNDDPARVAALYLSAITELQSGADTYLSLKPPALRYSLEIAQSLALAAAGKSLRLHCDSHGPEVADASNAFCTALLAHLPPQKIGTTLPGRWQRSLTDADWAIAKGLCVRVVKGQWPDPADPTRDLAQGFLAVIDRLAQGGARHVAVATQDGVLAREAITRLQAAHISCELEVLLGMPSAPLLAWAKANGVKTRLYVPYGPGFIPNAIGVLRRNPRLLWAVAKDRARAVVKILRRR